LDEVIASYLLAVEKGQSPNRQDLIERHPNLADALTDFFVNFDRMDRIASPLQMFISIIFRRLLAKSGFFGESWIARPPMASLLDNDQVRVLLEPFRKTSKGLQTTPS